MAFNVTKLVNLAQRSGIFVAARRNFGVTYTLAAGKSSDPIQQLFVDKVREYSNKQKQAGGGLVEPSPEFQAQLAEELERVNRVYGVKGKAEEFTKFPTVAFADEKMPPVNVEYKEDLTFDVNIPVVSVQSDPDKAPFDHLM